MCRVHGDREGYLNILDVAAAFHDFGKLQEENQEILSGSKNAKRLPINHVDAGVTYLKKDCAEAAVLVYSHHSRLPDIPDILGGNNLRCKDLIGKTEKHIDDFEKIHSDLNLPISPKIPSLRLSPISFRLLLSCMVDADHTDAASYRETPLIDKTPTHLRPAERLASLDSFVDKLPRNPRNNDERDDLRREMYKCCRNADHKNINIVSCDSPVGSGKTTAIMAHLLSVAERRGLRRIFVVLPFTNIISQSVDIYRKSLVLDGEDPKEVVAELHHLADFENANSRHLTALWRAPIVVTTAVAFFETLSSNSAATLRRLHELPGSAIFVDEAHAALPAKLLPLAWQWMRHFADEWGCYWALVSGSLNRFWEIDCIALDNKHPVSEIVGEELRQSLSNYEHSRV